jgi:hypothetical protein
MRTSEKTELIFPAFLKSQKEMKELVKNKENPFLKSNYADLGAVLKTIKPTFHANGIAIAQDATETAAGLIVTTLLIHESGQWIEATSPIPMAKKDAQAAGSALSYGRRYGLKGVAGLSEEDEDDDGGSASELSPKDDRSEDSLKEITTRSINEINDLFKILGASENDISATAMKFSGDRTDAVEALMSTEGKKLLAALKLKVSKKAIA